MSAQFGSHPFELMPRNDPGEAAIPTEGFITLCTFGSSSANPANMSVVRHVAEGYRRTLAAIRNVPDLRIDRHWN